MENVLFVPSLMTEERSSFFDIAVEVFYDAWFGDRHLFLLCQRRPTFL